MSDARAILALRADIEQLRAENALDERIARAMTTRTTVEVKYFPGSDLMQYAQRADGQWFYRQDRGTFKGRSIYSKWHKCSEPASVEFLVRCPGYANTGVRARLPNEPK